MLPLEVEGLSYSRPAVAGDASFSLQVGHFSLAAGSSVGIVGPSGCGKSTLIDLFAMLRKPDTAARFAIRGQDVMALWQKGGASACTTWRGRHVGVVLQTGGLLPSLPVWDNVMLSRYPLGMTDEAWPRHLLHALGLESFKHRLPGQLSIGQRQRVAIARALAHRPSLVFADEPTASLGVEHAPAALRLLQSLTIESEAALMVVSHDVGLLRQHGIAVTRCVMAHGVMGLDAAP